MPSEKLGILRHIGYKAWGNQRRLRERSTSADSAMPDEYSLRLPFPIPVSGTLMNGCTVMLVAAPICRR